MLTIARHFYAIFMQHKSCFCKQKKHGSGWYRISSVYYILLNLWIEGECQAVFAFWKKNMLFVKSFFNFFFSFKAKFIFCKIDLKYPLAAEEVEIISFLRWRKRRVERYKKQNNECLLSFNVVY